MTFPPTSFEEVLEALPDAVLVFEHAHPTLVHANDRACALLGYTLPQLQALRPIDLCAEDESQRTACIDALLAALDGDPTSVQWRARRADGGSFWAELRARRVCLGHRTLVVVTARDVSDVRAASGNLLHDMQRLNHHHETILGAVPDGIVSVDAQGSVSMVNPAAARVLGFEIHELLATNFHDRVGWSDSNGCPCPRDLGPVEQVLATGIATSSIGAVFHRRDGSSFPVEFAVAPMLDDGIIEGAVISFVDVTHHHEVSRMKGEFVSIVSHELRTPLTSIRGSLGLLVNGVFGRLTDRGQHMLEIALSNTDRLVRLINDILDLERMESGRVKMERLPCQADHLATLAVDAVRGVADREDVRLDVRCEPVGVMADADRLVQVLTNLLGNAIKFSPRGAGVELTVRRESTYALFEVRDHGRGIPAEKQEMIFERFQQVDASDSREKGGSGLGLPICRSIVEQHEGRIWTDSPPDGGSVFRFTVPLVERERQSPRPQTRRLAGPRDGERLRVLIAEDDPDLAVVISASFERLGLDAMVARTGTEAILLSQEHWPDLLVLDLGLPEHDGFQVVEWLRHFQRLQDLTIVVYTARDLTAAEQNALQLGRTTFLTKSRVSIEEFHQHIEALMPGLLATET